MFLKSEVDCSSERNCAMHWRTFTRCGPKLFRNAHDLC